MQSTEVVLRCIYCLLQNTVTYMKSVGLPFLYLNYAQCFVFDLPSILIFFYFFKKRCFGEVQLKKVGLGGLQLNLVLLPSSTQIHISKRC